METWTEMDINCKKHGNVNAIVIQGKLLCPKCNTVVIPEPTKKEINSSFHTQVILSLQNT
jgi:hypothetical protein